MRIPFVTPSDRILLSVERTLEQFDWVAAGFEMRPQIRHAKRVFSAPDQFPCITIRYEEDGPREADQNDGYLSSNEEAVEMRLTLEIDFEPFEVEQDPTGLGFSSAMAFLTLRALKDPEGDLISKWAVGVSDRGRGEDPDSTNDAARLEQGVIVLYRVSAEDPSVILAPGVDL